MDRPDVGDVDDATSRGRVAWGGNRDVTPPTADGAGPTIGYRWNESHFLRDSAPVTDGLKVGPPYREPVTARQVPAGAGLSTISRPCVLGPLVPRRATLHLNFNSNAPLSRPLHDGTVFTSGPPLGPSAAEDFCRDFCNVGVAVDCYTILSEAEYEWSDCVCNVYDPEGIGLYSFLRPCTLYPRLGQMKRASQLVQCILSSTVEQRDVPGIDSAYLAMDTEEGVEVVWNEVQFSERKNFKAQEEKIQQVFENLTQLEHPNIVKFHRYWTDTHNDKPRVIFITEYMSSGSLKQFLKRTKRNVKKLPLQAWKRWCSQILSALRYVSSRPNEISHTHEPFKSVQKVVYDLNWLNPPVT
ncbi:Nuclear receptor-binding protein [Homalodisca vitripennis]|nr:Nuclear receptor-binding protein [Homalodisca vitripennis]